MAREPHSVLSAFRFFHRRQDLSFWVRRAPIARDVEHARARARQIIEECYGISADLDAIECWEALCAELWMDAA